MELLQVLKNVHESRQYSFPIFEGGHFIIRLLIDLLTASAIIGLVHYRINRRSEPVFTFFSLNIMIFLITFLLNKVEMTMGAAFGLFAVFSMLRYRTENISAKDMTYVFTLIALGLVTAVSRLEWIELTLVALLILLSVVLLESELFIKREYSRHLIYEKIELVHAGQMDALMKDLREKTGLNIHRIEIGQMDFLKDSAHITIYYHEIWG